MKNRRLWNTQYGISRKFQVSCYRIILGPSNRTRLSLLALLLRLLEALRRSERIAQRQAFQQWPAFFAKTCRTWHCPTLRKKSTSACASGCMSQVLLHPAQLDRGPVVWKSPLKCSSVLRIRGSRSMQSCSVEMGIKSHVQVGPKRYEAVQRGSITGAIKQTSSQVD